MAIKFVNENNNHIAIVLVEESLGGLYYNNNYGNTAERNMKKNTAKNGSFDLI